MRLGFATAAFILLGGCGYVGPPLPPALHIPRPVTDLSVEEIGDKIIVRFTPPATTTDDLPVTGMRAITLYVGPGETPFLRERWAATATPYQIAVTKNEFEIKASDWAGQQVTIGLRTTGRTGKESDWSNFDLLAAAAPLIVPTAVTPTNAPYSVALKWNGNSPRYRILRATLSDPMPKLEPVAEVDTAEYFDLTIAEGARYQYVILGIAGTKQQSLPSEPVEFSPKDEFAPATPVGLTAVAGGASVNLSWTGNTEEDLEGYNIFRAVGDGAFEAIAQHVALPAYNDTAVEAGKRYRYTISAMDRTGNPSMRSMEAAAQIE
ncbi:MAG: hypothetical protein ABIR70_24215 [Bryobacteraceae bacterium]